MFVVGDYNARVGNGAKKDYIVCDRFVEDIDDDAYEPDIPLARRSLDNGFNAQGVKLLDLCKATSVCIANGRLGDDHMVGSYTYSCRNGSSVIDYLLLQETDFHKVENFRVADFNEFSDHSPIAFSIKCSNVTKHNQHYEFTRYKWNDEFRDIFRKRLIERLPDFNRVTLNVDTEDRESVNNSVNSFTDIIKEAADPLFSRQYSGMKKVEYRTTTNKPAAWFDDDCKEAKSEYMDALKTFNRSKTEENRQLMCQKKLKYKSLVRRKRRQYETKRIKDIERLRHSKPRDFWRLCLRKKHTNEPVDIESFYKHFSELSSDISTVHHDASETFCEQTNFNETDPDFEELDKKITVFEVKEVIKALKHNKSVGTGGLLNEYFLESADILISHLTDVFNHILSSGYFPEKWTEGIVIPLFKKGDPDDVNNYRGITLLSCLSKIFTGVLNKRVNAWCEEHNIISDSQFGFRKGCSTTDAIFVLHKILNDKKRLYCPFVDLKKAFDSIYRNAL